MATPRIVVDTCVLLSALRSKKGASFRVLSLVGRAKFEICLSVPLVLEYESAAKRHARSLGLRHSDINDILDYLCRVGEHREIFYLWRPFLKDPMDDMVLELAVESQSDFIVTHNIRDFAGVEEFRVKAITPQALLRKIGEIP
jgi:putative PIN family toxin of toxin-antitoxin system